MGFELDSGAEGKKSNQRSYSLEKFRAAPKTEDALDGHEAEFILDYAQRMDDVVARINKQPSIARGILSEVMRPDLWRLLFDKNKAEVVVTKVADSQPGQLVLAQEEAEMANEEYDRRAAAVMDAIRNFATFVEELSGRS